MSLTSTQKHYVLWPLQYGAVDVGDDYVAALERDTKLELVYIASNHASHAFYAIEAIKRGLDVFIEKPITVNRQQFDELVNTVNTPNSKVYVGYNKLFAPTTYRLRELAKEHCGPLFLAIFRNSTYTANGSLVP